MADISVSSSFDSGNIEVLSVGATIDLQIRLDPRTEGTDNTSHAMWFHFRVANARDKECQFRIMNASKCSYPEGWTGYWTCCSYDLERWFRVPTTYGKFAEGDADDVLSFSITPAQDVVWFAYWAPYTYEQHQQLIVRCMQTPGTRVRSIGKTLDGRDLDLVTVGSGKLRAWFTARQHPGESMAEYWMEGFLVRLLDPDDALARRLLGLFTFFVIPNMNPDGSIRGYLRTNASGANLNREWARTKEHMAPTMEQSPEVFLTLKEMGEVGVDFFMDVHGDEELPHNFFAGSQGASRWTPWHGKVLQTMACAYQAANPDFGNLLYNYGNDEHGKANPAMAAEQVCERFGAVTITLEQPFKDCFDHPEPTCGYSPQRAKRLGASVLDALSSVATDLANGESEVDLESLAEWARPGYPCPPAVELSWA